VLLPGVKVCLDIEQADGTVSSKTWSYPNGLAGYLTELAGNAEAVARSMPPKNTPTPTMPILLPAKARRGHLAGMSMPWPPNRMST
jgi:hypothetical protein